MSKIFISYRRSDSADVMGRIVDRLELDFGEEKIFKDVDDIEAGVDFRQSIANAVQACDVVLAIIGDKWLEVRDGESGQRRIDKPNDFVRVELETALKRDIRVIPVLVRGTVMPSADQLPESLKALAFRNAIKVRPDPDFSTDIDRLSAALQDRASKRAGLCRRRLRSGRRAARSAATPGTLRCTVSALRDGPRAGVSLFPDLCWLRHQNGIAMLCLCLSTPCL